MIFFTGRMDMTRSPFRAARSDEPRPLFYGFISSGIPSL
jgi:hypothetical protein